MINFLSIMLLITGMHSGASITCMQEIHQDTAIIRKTADFSITGSGDNDAWKLAEWLPFAKMDSGGVNYPSKSKMLYSEKGLYVLFTGEDQRITTKDYKDDDDIYEGDVFELFLHPDPSAPAYFEYEINQLGKQLVLILSGAPSKNIAWSPWRTEYEQHPVIQRKVTVNSTLKKDIKLKPGMAIRSWSAELFFPYAIFGLLHGLPPESGMIWRANYNRIDYDSGKMIQYTWSTNIKSSFHELENLGYIRFE